MDIVNKKNQDSEKQFVEAKQKKELTKLGSIKKRKGLFLFMAYQGVVSKVELTPVGYELGKTNTKRSSVITIPGAVYVQALNIANAERKFLKKGVTINKT